MFTHYFVVVGKKKVNWKAIFLSGITYFGVDSNIAVFVLKRGVKLQLTNQLILGF